MSFSKGLGRDSVVLRHVVLRTILCLTNQEVRLKNWAIQTLPWILKRLFKGLLRQWRPDLWCETLSHWINNRRSFLLPFTVPISTSLFCEIRLSYTFPSVPVPYQVIPFKFPFLLLSGILSFSWIPISVYVLSSLCCRRLNPHPPWVLSSYCGPRIRTPYLSTTTKGAFSHYVFLIN